MCIRDRQSDGYLYYCKRTENGRTFWKCQKYKFVSARCPGRLITFEGVMEKSKITIMLVMLPLPRFVRSAVHLDTRDTPKFILSGSVSKCSQASLSQLPSQINLKKTVRTARKKVGPHVSQIELQHSRKINSIFFSYFFFPFDQFFLFDQIVHSA